MDPNQFKLAADGRPGSSTAEARNASRQRHRKGALSAAGKVLTSNQPGAGEAAETLARPGRDEQERRQILA
jgi:hypothetical protein